MRFLPFLLLGTLAVALTATNDARAVITYQSAGAVAYSGGGGGAGTVSPAYPASIAAGDLLVLIIGMKPSTANSGSVTTPAGWTPIVSLTGAGGYGTTLGADTGNTNVFTYYIVATGTETGTLAITLTTNNISWAQMYRLSNVSFDWNVAGTTGSDTTAGSVSITMSANPGVTANDFILGGMVIPTDVTTPGQFSAQALTQTGITFGTVTEISEPDSTTNNDIGGFTIRAPVNSGTASAAPVLTATAGGTTTNVRGPGVFIRIREPLATVLRDATDPGNSTLAPGAAATMADAFTFQTTTGTDTITSVTVGLGAGAAAGLSLVEITNAAGTVVYGSVTNPATDTPTITLSTTTLTATTTQTQYRIRVTPKTHANMPAPPGATYTVTAKINSWTGTNTQVGSDTAGTTLTIDNQSPGDVTGASGSTGDTQIALSWTNPADADFSNVLILRNTVAVADTPVEGVTYSVGNTIGSSVVRYVLAGTTFTDTGLTNGTDYYYRIFSRDTNGNYAVGVALGPLRPAANRYAVATGIWHAPGTWSSSACGLPQVATPIPTADNNVTICAGVTVTLTAPGFCSDLAFDIAGGASTLAHNAGIPLVVGGGVTINGSTSTASTKLWNIGAGIATVSGNVTLNGGSLNTRVARITITTGTLNINGDLTYNAGNTARAVIDMSGGAGTLNLRGALTVNNGTLTPGTSSTFNYNGTAAQTVRINASNIDYHHLHLNNTSASGATLDATVSSANVTGDLRVQTGILNNGGNAVFGGAGDTFEVANGARFNLSGVTAMPTGYSTVTLGPTSTVNFQGAAQNVAALTYGHLILDGGSTKTMLAGTTTVAGDFTLGSATTYNGTTNNPTVNLAGNFSNSGTFNAGTGVFTFDGPAAQGITGATTFGNLVINNAAGVTANSDLGITGNFTNTAGFNAGTTTTTFNGSANQTLTGATTFYGLTFDNAAGFTLSNDITASNALSLTNGIVATGGNKLIYGSTTSCAVTRTSGHVNGNFQKTIQTGSPNCTFEVGDSTNYAPVDLSFNGVTVADNLTVSTTATDHPQIDSSGIDSSTNVNRYWTLTKGGSLAFTNYSATFNYIDPTDHDDTTRVSDYVIRRYLSGAWNVVSLSGPASLTQAGATGLTDVGEFAIGAPPDLSLRERQFIYTREVYY